jgi:hypothetical protein
MQARWSRAKAPGARAYSSSSGAAEAALRRVKRAKIRAFSAAELDHRLVANLQQLG